MFARMISLAAGLAGGAGAAQFPEFSQQYVQRLGGAVDELAIVVRDFDASAEAAGLTRASALEDLSGSTFRNLRRSDMERTISRYERLSASLTLMREERAAGRLALSYGAFDQEIAKATLDDFRPAVPVTVEGFAFAAGGFALGYLLIGALLAPFRRKRNIA